jgi:hypothetical protein
MQANTVGRAAADASLWSLLLATRAPGWSILIRFAVGLVVFFPTQG